MRYDLVVKSNKYVLGTFSGFLLCLFLFFISLSENKVYSFIWIIVGLICLFFCLKTFILPKVLISYDQNGIYLNHKKNLFIPYEKIGSVISKQMRSKRSVFSFGYIYITSMDKKYKIGVIDGVNYIQNRINELKVEKMNKSKFNLE